MKKELNILVVVSSLLMLAAAQTVAAAEYEEGVSYARIAVPVETQDPSRIEVVELFSYACVHCKTFDPTLEAWRQIQPDDVLFRREPAIFNQTWALFAQAFYTAQVLGISDEIHTPMFLAIHEQGVDLRDPAMMAALFQSAAGIPPEEFTQVFNSFGVRSRVQQADAHGRAYGVTGVPTLIVDGQFRVDGRMAGDNTGMLQVVDYLVKQQRIARNMDEPALSAPEVPAAPVGLEVN